MVITIETKVRELAAAAVLRDRFHRMFRMRSAEHLAEWLEAGRALKGGVHGSDRRGSGQGYGPRLPKQTKLRWKCRVFCVQSFLYFWWSQAGSNRRPLECHSEFGT
ncbi:hypothetical protein ORIO_00595 [Cereibacter azotoformans]|nr:hypothetical protein [Cereibacter azotoformans]ULB08440.1 hypothetical protein ORIO_00595 [Cereibacter azotoformans]